MARWARDIYPAPDPHFMSGGVKFYFLSELIAMIPKGKQPNRESILRLIRADKLRAKKFGREWVITEQAWSEFLQEIP